MPGHHNALNATAAVAVAFELGLSPDMIRKALAGFGGVKRRFTRTGEWNGATIFDDYGHHPVEIAAVLRAARAATKGQVIAIVQPHRYTRLESLFDQFATCFNDADAVIVSDVYSAGEAPIEGASRDDLVAAIRAHGHRHTVALSSPDALPRSSPISRDRAITSCFSARDRSRNGPMRCRRNFWGGDDSPAQRGQRMTFPDLTPRLPTVRGRLSANEPLAPLTWFRVGGPAQALFVPADEADLSGFLANCPPGIPVTVVGLGSNLIVRDGGVPGVVIRLSGRAFGEVAFEDDGLVRTGTGVPDKVLARRAQAAGVAGLEFFSGVPGAIGGALRMNAGAHGGETRDVLVGARGVSREGTVRDYAASDMGMTYRHSDVPDDVIFTSAVFRGRPGGPATIAAEMDRITAAREAAQPIREKTGGSTFKNPPGEKAWQLVDRAGCRGLVVGDAQVSEMHCNFLINRGRATAAEIEALGDEVRRRVREMSGIDLSWEIRRIGVAAISNA